MASISILFHSAVTLPLTEKEIETYFGENEEESSELIEALIEIALTTLKRTLRDNDENPNVHTEIFIGDVSE